MTDRPKKSTGARRAQSLTAVALIVVLFILLREQQIEFLGLEIAAAWPGLAMALLGTWAGRTYLA